MGTHRRATAPIMKILAILALLFVVQGVVEAAYCGSDDELPRMKLIDFIKWQMDSPYACEQSCDDDSDCEYWKFRKPDIRRRRTCSLYYPTYSEVSAASKLFGLVTAGPACAST